jgi:hypothetical protein
MHKKKQKLSKIKDIVKFNDEVNAMYDLETLIETFKKHAVLAEENNKEIIKSFQENHPGEPLPGHMKDDFSICKALISICSEILKLKNNKNDIL